MVPNLTDPRLFRLHQPGLRNGLPGVPPLSKGFEVAGFSLHPAPYKTGPERWLMPGLKRQPQRELAHTSTKQRTTELLQQILRGLQQLQGSTDRGWRCHSVKE